MRVPQFAFSGVYDCLNCRELQSEHGQLGAQHVQDCGHCIGRLKRWFNTKKAVEFKISLKLYVATQSAGKMNILNHEGDAASMDGAENGVLEEPSEITFGRRLKGEQSFSRPADLLAGEQVVANTLDYTSKRKFRHKQFSRFL